MLRTRGWHMDLQVSVEQHGENTARESERPKFKSPRLLILSV